MYINLALPHFQILTLHLHRPFLVSFLMRASPFFTHIVPKLIGAKTSLSELVFITLSLQIMSSFDLPFPLDLHDPAYHCVTVSWLRQRYADVCYFRFRSHSVFCRQAVGVSRKMSADQSDFEYSYLRKDYLIRRYHAFLMPCGA